MATTPKTTPPDEGAPAKTAAATYKVLDRVQHNGKTFEAGKTVKLDEATAAPLLAVRCVELAAKE